MKLRQARNGTNTGIGTSRTAIITHFMPSEFIALHGTLKIVGEPDLDASHTKLMKQVTGISNDMAQLIMAILKVLLMKYFITDYIPAEKRIEIEDAPSLFDVSIPFFVFLPSEPPST